MPVILPKIVIATMDKCGSQWIKHAMKAACPDAIIQPHSPPLKNIDLPDRMNVIFVRHPLAWYKSYWIFRRRFGYTKKERGCCSLRHLDRYIKEPEGFDQFIENVLVGQDELNEPYLEYQYKWMMGDLADRVGKVENLLNDLISFLDEAKQPYDKKILTEYPRLNVAETDVPWNDELAKRICEQEKEVIDKYYANTSA